MVFDDGWIWHDTAGLHGYATSHPSLRDIPILLVGAMRYILDWRASKDYVVSYVGRQYLEYERRRCTFKVGVEWKREIR